MRWWWLNTWFGFEVAVLDLAGDVADVVVGDVADVVVEIFGYLGGCRGGDC